MNNGLRYHPVLGDAEREIDDVRPDRVLVVGDEVPVAVALAGEARRCGSEVPLPMGVYVFGDGGGPAEKGSAGPAAREMMIVTVGAPAGEPASVLWDAAEAEDHPLRSAYDWLGVWWDGATVIDKPRFQVSASVVTQDGREAVVRGREHDDGQWWYQVRVDGRTVTMRERNLREPDLDDDPEDWIARLPASADRFAATLTRAKLGERLTDTVYSFRATRTVFRAYQFRPVIRLLQTGELRLLIADEVGLGKTIEAGLVWTELDARGHADRVLVVCPSMLVPKWRMEMRERFDYELAELDRQGLDEMAERFGEERMPPRGAYICSLERLRVWEGLEELAELMPEFDLVIVDEAHAFRNSETRSHALGQQLSEWADALVFLSATPLNLGNDDLYSLLQLLAPGEFDDRFVLEQRLEPNAVLHQVSASLFEPAVTNTQRLALLRSIEALSFGPAVTVRPEYRQLQQMLSEPEMSPERVPMAKRLIAQLHALSAVVTRTRKVEVQEHKAVREAVLIEVDWTEEEGAFYAAFRDWQIARARATRMPVGFVTQMPLRLASSCLPAARQRVLNWRDGEGDEDLDATADEAVEWDLTQPPAEVVQLARAVGDVDTKFDMFLPQLRQLIDEKRRVLLFTFSRRTLAYLHERLAPEMRVAVLHGEVKPDERHRTMKRFRDHEFDVLLASRVASEGLDFEFCSAVVNYDLPWNPMEVEQRIGRVDRYGQTEEKIFVLNFHTPGTIEADIIDRVHRRIGVFEASIGELEPILQSRVAGLRRTMFDFKLTDEERIRRLDEILAAIEEQRLALGDVETAASYLSSTDQVEIDGLEQDLLSTGKYIGQLELVHLLRDWTADAPGSRCSLDRDRTHLTFRGTAALEIHLRGVETAGERSRTEIDRLARDLLDERDVVLCLDQELARVTGQPLLSANHPLVRAALRVQGASQARFASLRVQSGELAPGQWFVLVAVARWRGLRDSTEFWSSAVDLSTGVSAGDEVGAVLLAALAEGRIEPGPDHQGTDDPAHADLAARLRAARRLLRRRQEEEAERRQEMNEALVETRRISLRETHARKVAQIEGRIRTLRERGSTGVVRLHEAQLGHQSRRLQEQEARLEEGRMGSMQVETIAACVIEVAPA